MRSLRSLRAGRRNWASETTGRFVQIMRFRDRKHQQAVQAAERSDAAAQTLIKEFCELINFPYQQQQGLFAVGFYTALLPVGTTRVPPAAPPSAAAPSGPLPSHDTGPHDNGAASAHTADHPRADSKKSSQLSMTVPTPSARPAKTSPHPITTSKHKPANGLACAVVSAPPRPFPVSSGAFPPR